MSDLRSDKKIDKGNLLDFLMLLFLISERINIKSLEICILLILIQKKNEQAKR